MHGDTAHFPLYHLALARMQARADLDPESSDALRDRSRAAHGTRGAIEASEESVPGDVELRAVEASELAADERVMALEQLPPRTIAKLDSLRSRADDVSEENRGEDTVRLFLLPATRLPHVSHEPLDLTDDGECSLSSGEVPDTGHLDDARRRDA